MTMAARTAAKQPSPHCRPWSMILFLGMLAVVVSLNPAHALWLPWATDVDKVKKVLTDVWQAVADKNKRALTRNLGGNAVDAFVDKETKELLSQKIKNYECRFKTIQVDPAEKKWAWVLYDKIAIFDDGKKKSTESIAVLQKIDGEWKLMTGIKSKHERRKDATEPGQPNKSPEGTDKSEPAPKPEEKPALTTQAAAAEGAK